MKNKLFLLSLGLVALLTGCNNENDAGSSPGNSSMESFRLELPVATTRAAGDIYTPTRYIMEVYPDKAATGIPLMHMEQDNGTFNVSLTYGSTYTCLFWADNGTPDNVVNDEYETADLKAVKVKTDFCPANPAYGGRTQITAGVSGTDAYNVLLAHAVAKVDYIQTKPLTSASNTLTVVFPTTFQLNVGDWNPVEIASTSTTHVFTNIDKAQTETAIATSYVIAPSATASTQNLTITLNSETAKQISNVPLQRNYKTNLKGAFSDFYNADMTCTLTPEWDSPETDKELISIWDGTTVTQPADYSADTPGKVEITSAAELAWLAEQTDGTNQKTFSGYTFTLTTDIDLRNHLWSQIGRNNSGFQGTLDGNGHTVRGIYANNTDTEQYVGFINYLYGGTVKNITIRGYINGLGPQHTPCCFGGLVGQAKGATIESCNNACTLAVGGEQFTAGGIAGDAENTLIQDCANEGTIKNTGNNSINICIGGIAGSLDSGDSTASTLNRNVNKGKIVYTSIYNGAYLGGIAGEIHAKGTIVVSNNVNNGEVISTSGEYRSYNKMGGIIGNLYAFSNYAGTITINDNQNKGNVSSYYDDYRGGIISQAIGRSKLPITLTNNSIAEGTPADIVIALCLSSDSTITIDGTSVTEIGPYPSQQ